MKFKAIVEYDYPTEHKPPVKAELILHGDRVVTDNIIPLGVDITNGDMMKALFSNQKGE